jgi:hypothetical protein
MGFEIFHKEWETTENFKQGERFYFVKNTLFCVKYNKERSYFCPTNEKKKRLVRRPMHQVRDKQDQN